MCYNYNVQVLKRELEKRYDATFESPDLDEKFDIKAHGFERPSMPVITDNQPETIQLLKWGYIKENTPDEVEANKFEKGCLNIKYESIKEYGSFKNVHYKKRCIVPATSFYEWQHLGSEKQKFEIKVEQADVFSMAGLYGSWTNPRNNEVIHTYRIVTFKANELMSDIHNSKKRMPFILRPDQEAEWLNGDLIDVDMHLNLKALPIDLLAQTRLFG